MGNTCESCEGKRSKSCVYCRAEAYSNSLRNFSPEQQATIEYYRNMPVWEGINAATKYDINLQCLDIFEQLKEAYSFELTENWLEEILNKSPTEKLIFNRSRRCTIYRKSSWYSLLIKQKEAIEVFPNRNHFLFEYGKEGDLLDYGFYNSESFFFLSSSSIYDNDPEKIHICRERHHTIEKFPWLIEESGKKHAHIYRKIIEMQLAGTNVTSKHISELGIKTGKVADYKHQIKKWLMDYVAKEDDEVAKKQKVQKSQSNIELEIKKSTFEERKELFRDTNAERFPPKNIRIWKIANGRRATGPIFDKFTSQKKSTGKAKRVV